jgi:hypothetical protein
MAAVDKKSNDGEGCRREKETLICIYPPLGVLTPVQPPIA